MHFYWHTLYITKTICRWKSHWKIWYTESTPKNNKHLKKSNAACFYTPIVLKLLVIVQMW